MTEPSRIIVVTGGAKGIGRACARRFAAAGDAVVIADIDGTSGEAAAEAIVRAGGQAVFEPCDVAKTGDAARLVERTLRRFGRIDHLLGNAGIALARDFLQLTEEEFDRVLGVNLKGGFLVAQAAARAMVGQAEAGLAPPPGGYSITLMSSVNAVVAIASQVPYAVSKGGLNQLAKGMALALAPHRIRVNAIGPGSVMTDVLKGVAGDEAAIARIHARTPLKRIAEPEEIAGIAFFLASADASYITGTCLYADGGRLALNYTV